MARFNLNFNQFSPVAQALAREVGLKPGSTNPYRSIIVRGIEILHACEEALAIVEAYAADLPTPPTIDTSDGVGVGCVEAPRGLCWHRYRLDENGSVRGARIIAPTAQNHCVIERDLKHFAQMHANRSPDRLKWQCEQLVRSYDPCISCACHLVDACGAD